MAMLRSLGHPQDVVETDYVWTTSYLTGHRTAGSAAGNICIAPALAGVVADHASYFLTAATVVPGTVSNPCVLQQLSQAPWAVRSLPR